MPDYNRFNGYGEDKDEPTSKKLGPGQNLSSVRIKSAVPEITEKRCHVCQHPHRHQIERLIALGTNYTSISKTFGGKPDRRSISTHAKEHLSYEQAAIREIIEHEAQQVQANYEDGLKGAVMYRSYLSAALKKAWDDLIEGNARIDPAVAIQIIQQMDKFDRESKTAASEELQFQFNCFMEAVKRIVPRDMWEEIAAETGKLAAREADVEGRAIEE